MGSVNMDCDTKREMDDSGCVQDDTLSNGQVSLLDLSDDVLLYILRHCSPRDLKALGYSCSRLGRLVQERALWRRVDARSEPCSKARLRWFLDNALHDDTQVLMISGYAKAAEGCLGFINVSREEAEEERKQSQREGPSSAPSNISDIPEELHQIPIPVHLERHHARFFVTAQRTTHLPRFRGFPSWPDALGRRGPQQCRGPHFSLSQSLMSRLGDNCPRLTSLAVEYCNIDCNTTSLGSFPRTLKKLSMRGSKCYNMTIDKSFLFKIQDYLPVLESLDVSECEWMDPATLLPLSKLASLEELFMRDCHKLAEFVAYASLTARYGFRTLKVLDLRGSPVGDSEVSALGWMPRLERLWLSAARAADRHAHAHYAGDARIYHTQLHAWELTEPDCFKFRSGSDSEDITIDDIEDVSQSEGNMDTDRYSKLCSCGVKNNKRKQNSSAEMNAESQSKRQKVSQNSENNGIENDNNENEDKDSKNNDNKEKESKNIDNEEKKSKNIDNEEKKSKNNDNEEKKSKNIDNEEKESNNTDNEEKESNNTDNEEKESNNTDNEEKESNNTDNEEKENKINDNKGKESKIKDNEDKDSKNNDNKNQEEQRHRNSPDCIVDCIKIDQLIDVGELRRGRQNEVIVIANSAKVRSPSGSRHQDSYVCFRRNQNPVYVDVENQEGRNNVNEGASTSKEKKEENNDTENDENDNSDAENNAEKYVHFRKNQDPVYVNCAPEEQNHRREPLPPVQYQIEPRHHVLYVSVGPQINTYRFPRDSAEMERQINLNFMPSHVDSSSLVTDFAIRRFGRADGEDVNIIHIGPNGPMVVGQANGSRPDRSNLRFLSVTGYRNITDRSLVHLASAAPNLTFIDFSDTNVSEDGAESFRSLRPDCELIFSPFVDKKEK